MITGIGGFIGKELADALNKSGYEVYGLSRARTKIKNARVYYGDVCNISQTMRFCRGKDIIIHLAAVTEHKSIVENPVKSLEVSVIGIFNMLKSFERNNGEVFIFPSSGKVYGPPVSLPYTESHVLNPQTYLGRIKKFCEEIAAFFSESSDKSYSVLRIFNVYGKNQKSNFLVPAILSQLRHGRVKLGDIKSKRDYIYIKDLVSAFLTIIKERKAGLETYNVGSGVSYSPSDIVNIISNLTKKKFGIEIDESRLRKNESFDERADIAKLKGIGWRPKYAMEQGLSEMLKKVYD